MPTTDSHGLVAPTVDDPFAPDSDMRAMRDPLHARIAVPVANQTARDSLAAAHAPTTSKPLLVYRADLDEYEYTKDGSTWRTLGTGPHAHVVRASTAQSIPSGGYHSISWDTEVEDPDGMWSSSQPTRLTATRAGLYTVSASVALSGAGSGDFGGHFLRNGAQVPGSAFFGTYRDAGTSRLTMPIRLTVGQYVEFQVNHSTGSNKPTFTIGTLQPFMSMTWLRS